MAAGTVSISTEASPPQLPHQQPSGSLTSSDVSSSLPPSKYLPPAAPIKPAASAACPSSRQAAKPSLLESPDLRELFSRRVWQHQIRRRLQPLRPKALAATLREERWTILVALAFAAMLLALQFTAWRHLSADAWFTVWVVYACTVPMVRGCVDPDVCLFGGATVLLLRGIITPRDAFAGLANESIVTIALMMAIAAGLESSGALEFVPELVLGRSRREWVGQLRMYVSVAAVSAVMNNTPLVAVMIPVVEAWCRAANQHVSRFMMPLSYAAILGGLCTVIGTSTTLIARGLAQDAMPDLSIPFFEIGIIGLPLTVAGGIYVVIFSRWLLPKRDTLLGPGGPGLGPGEPGAGPGGSSGAPGSPVAQREYAVSVRVDARYGHIGRTVQDAGLTQLRGLALTGLRRADGQAVPAPVACTSIALGDLLTFSGDIGGVHHLMRLPGLTPVSSAECAADTEEGWPCGEGPGAQQEMVEAVVSLSSPIVNMTIRDCHFRSRYSAVVLAVHRNGSRLGGSLGDVVVKGGDTMLLQAAPGFLERYRCSSEWALVVDAFRVAPRHRDPIALIIALSVFSAMIVLNSMDILSLATTALVCLYVFLATGVMSVGQFRASIPGVLLLAVAGAFGIARALTVTGVATQLAQSLLSVFSWMGRSGPVAAVYVATALLTALLSNGAAVTLMFPICMNLAAQAGINVKGPLYALMVGASSDFSTPIGYQTNIMVAGPGGYQFLDYTRFGLPLQLVVGLITVPICVLRFI